MQLTANYIFRRHEAMDILYLVVSWFQITSAVIHQMMQHSFSLHRKIHPRVLSVLENKLHIDVLGIKDESNIFSFLPSQ